MQSHHDFCARQCSVATQHNCSIVWIDLVLSTTWFPTHQVLWKFLILLLNSFNPIFILIHFRLRIWTFGFKNNKWGADCRSLSLLNKREINDLLHISHNALWYLGLTLGALNFSLAQGLAKVLVNPALTLPVYWPQIIVHYGMRAKVHLKHK